MDTLTKKVVDNEIEGDNNNNIKSIDKSLNMDNYNKKNNGGKFLRPFTIGLAGGSASGKTSVSEMIFEKVGMAVDNECLLIPMDVYYKNPRYLLFLILTKVKKTEKIYLCIISIIQMLWILT